MRLCWYTRYKLVSLMYVSFFVNQKPPRTFQFLGWETHGDFPMLCPVRG